MEQKNNYRSLFDRAVRIRLGRAENLDQIEVKVAHLRKGGQIRYEDLLLISDESSWPFNEFWRWPDRKQIEDKLITTEGLLLRIKGTAEAESEVIQRLLDIFSEISLVSIILRFVYPEDYGIYSLPVLETSKTKRGKNAIEDYLNYLHSLRLILGIKEMRIRYAIKRVADVDMLLFAISQLREKVHDEFNALFAKYFKPARSYLMEISSDFRTIIDRFDRNLKGRILDAIVHLSKEPFFAVGDTIKPLTKDLKGKWRYRIGNYRLIYFPDKERYTVNLLEFGPRSNIYD